MYDRILDYQVFSGPNVSPNLIWRTSGLTSVAVNRTHFFISMTNHQICNVRASYYTAVVYSNAYQSISSQRIRRARP